MLHFDDILVGIVACGKVLQAWHYDTFSRLSKDIARKQSDLAAMHNGLFLDVDMESDQLTSCPKELNDLLLSKESLWRQRVKQS